MKASIARLKPNRTAGAGRRWPGYLFGGRIRTSTVVLILAFVLVWWVYDTYRPAPEAPSTPQVVPPGFVPDPNYTWVPRTRLQQPPATVTETVTPTPTTPAPITPPGEPEPPAPPAFPFPLPPPFGPAPPPPPELPPAPAPQPPGLPPAPAPQPPHAAPATAPPPP